MPPVLAYAALAVAVGLVWRLTRRAAAPAGEAEAASHVPTEIFDAVPLVRGEDGVYRPGSGDL